MSLALAGRLSTSAPPGKPGRALFDINHSNIFFNLSLRVMERKTKINKWDLIKFKSFCTAKETTHKMKRQPTDWEKIFANDVTDMGLVSKIYKQGMQLKQPIQKTGRDRNKHFSKEDIQMAKRHMKRCSTSAVIRDMLSPHTSQNGYHQKIHKRYTLERVWREGNPPTLLVGM